MSLKAIGLVFGFVLFGFGGYYIGINRFAAKVQISNEKATGKEDTLCGIDKERISKPVVDGDTQYFSYTRNSMNVMYPSGNNNYSDSGMIAIHDNETAKCQKLIEVLDESPAKNNIYEMYSYRDSLYVMAVDQFGAGSGEGNAKILRSDDKGKTWSVKYCFYYTPEEKLTIKDFVTHTQNKVKLLSLDNPYCKNFILGVEGGRLK